MNKVSAIVLAAGESTRMKSSLPKVLHNLCGRSMISYIIDCVESLKLDKRVVIVGNKKKQVEENLQQNAESLTFITQKNRFGTGHAVKQAEKEFKDYNGDVLILCGDTPLLKKSTLQKVIRSHQRSKSAVTILTCNMDDPFSYGRILRDDKNKIIKIVEEKDATKKEKQINEINSGIYCFNSKKLFDALKRIRSNNKQKELYLTDVIEIFFNKQDKINSVVIDDSEEIMGINNRVELSKAGNIIRKSILNDLMKSGVTIIHPESTFIDKTVKIENDVTVYPFTMIEGRSIIGSHSKIGPNSNIKNSVLGKNVEVLQSVVLRSKVEDDVRIGPFANIRPYTVIESDVKVGNFCEIKKSNIKKGAKVSHLSYIGDSIIGKDVNIGAGTITCNYDGKNKFQTVIEEGAFIGSNSNLIAPVKIGKNAIIAAGSTINKDVPEEALGIARDKQHNIKKFRKKYNKK